MLTIGGQFLQIYLYCYVISYFCSFREGEGRERERGRQRDVRWIFPHLTPGRALQYNGLVQILEHRLKVMVTVVKPFPKHHPANDVGHSVVE